MKRRAIILLSGGLDSATALAIAKGQGFVPYAMTFAYGQRQRVELRAAQKVAERIGCAEHRFVHIDLKAIGGSALTADFAVPKDRLETRSEKQQPVVGESALPITYVPARNTIFLSYALAWAEVLRASNIFIGVNEVDYSGYPDCRPAFIAAFERLANLATTAVIQGAPAYQINAPLMHMSKADIIKTGLALGVDYRLTHSCYDPTEELACGHCDACYLRRRGFEQANVPDPTSYVSASSS